MSVARPLRLLAALALLQRGVTTSDADSCSANLLTEPSGIITSPGYPHSYPAHASCTWIILTPDNSELALRVLDLDIEEDSKKCSKPHCCSHNWLSISSKQICGQNISVTDLTQTTSGISMIKFHTSKVLRGGRGFQLKYLICKNREFRCIDNLKCVDASAKCDGILDCMDGSDEWDCKHSKKNHIILDECNGENLLPCGGSDSGCYNNVTERCNGIANCPNMGTDEKYCGVCGPNKLYCKSVGCYPLYGACDNIVHCAGGWDEGLKGGCGICAQDHVPCGFRDSCHCYHAHTQRCDGQIDCPGADDEISCVIGCEDKIACASAQGCYSPSERCDGITQCLDESDEIGCTGQLFPIKFKCTSTPRCVDEFMVCNGDDDCGDGSDESDCIRNSVITAVVMGSIACGLIAILGVAIGWRYYTARNRIPSISAHNIITQRPEDLEPLDDGSMYNMYREPPPSYQEAVMQGASPPMYWHPTRLMNMSASSETSVPVTSHRPRPRSTIVRPRPRPVPKTNDNLKPTSEEPANGTVPNTSNVIASDQYYPDDNVQTDSDTPMLELSDNNLYTSGTDNYASESNSSTPSGVSHTNIALFEHNNSYRPV